MWKNPNGATPSIVQTDFGPWGQNMPGDGEAYCAPTSIVMQLYYLGANGFTQLAPASYDGQTDPNSVAGNLEQVIAGLCGTTATGGTHAGVVPGVETYFSACGVSPARYTMTPVATGTPSLAWLTTALAPNVATSGGSIALTIFSVAWCRGDSASPTTLTWSGGGHVLAPLLIDTTVPASPKLILNNAFPASFENVPNLPGENPQTVQIVPVPSDWTIVGLKYPAGDYSQVISGNKGGPLSGQGQSNESYAILWGGQCWQISISALPSSSGYAPDVWSIAGPQALDTNGGVLTVVAPLSGAGGLVKTGLGSVILTASNALTGANFVGQGMLVSTLTTGTPFGTGGVTIQGGGTLAVASGGATSVASAAGSTLEFGAGAVLAINGTDAATVTIGNAADPTSLQRLGAGTLLLAPEAGETALGAGQQVTVGGSAPPTANGIVAPFILGCDSDSLKSGFFLVYGASGFAPAAPVVSTNVGINSAPVDAVYEALDVETIDAGGTVKLAALEVSGGAIEGGAGTSLLIGDQAEGSVAGVILNGGQINSGTLAFGAAEGVIYVSSTVGIISAPISAAALTLPGPGALLLTAPAAVTGTVAINAGMLIAAAPSGSPTVDATILVNADAALVVSGVAGGTINLSNAAALTLSGGTVAGEVTTANLPPPAPPAVLQGRGTLSGPVTFDGDILSAAGLSGNGAELAGLLTFTGAVTLVGAASFYWQLLRLVDTNSGGNPGADWNALVFTSSEITIGSSATQPAEPLTLYLDFSALGADPDGSEDSFWASKHQWTVISARSGGPAPVCAGGNFAYVCGHFRWNVMGGQDGAPWTVDLSWAPSQQPQSLDQRWLEEARSREGPGA